MHLVLFDYCVDEMQQAHVSNSLGLVGHVLLVHDHDLTDQTLS
jgi:hypothetical protein